MNQKSLTSEEIRQRFNAFWEKRGHKIVPSASLVPENDPTVLFNTAGMQPLVPYLLGREHPEGRRIANIQKCVRTVDIDDVGDNTHATFFEMMGNWSLGDYFKREAIEWSFALLTDKVEGFGLDPQRLYITCFEGDEKVPRDDEAAGVWKEIFDNNGVTGERIFFLGAEANWWPAVKKSTDAWTGPTGPCAEMFYDVTGKLNLGLSQEEFLKADELQQVVEIGNDVFMEYKKENGRIVGKLEKKNVDDGRGFERMVMVVQGQDNIFDTDLFSYLIDRIKSLATIPNIKSERILADHLRTSVMLIADGVAPSNSDQGYILRRLLRRAIRHADLIGIKQGSLATIAEEVIGKYTTIYDSVRRNSETIGKEVNEEETKFRKTLSLGLKEFEKGIDPFVLFATYGFPIELTLELAKEKGVDIDIDKFESDMKNHKEISKAGSEQKFKGGLGDTSDKSLQYHTATHLLHQALRDVLGSHVGQKGSNITPERLRFDFTHPQKMTEVEKAKVEEIVNTKIEANLPVKVATLSKEEAEKTGAIHFFGDKYGDTVTVYYIGDSLETAYSKEFCGGPHVTNTSDLKGVFKIQKEEAVSQGVRRIKAVLE